MTSVRGHIENALRILWDGSLDDTPEQDVIAELQAADRELGGDARPDGGGPVELDTVAPGHFQLRVRPGLTLADTQFEVSGYATGPAPDYDTLARQWVRDNRPGWGTGFAAMGRVAGRRLTPDDPRAGAVVSVTPLALSHHVFDNSGGRIPAHYTAELTDSISTTDSIGWDHSVTEGASYTVGLEVGEGPVKSSASASVSISTTVGRSASHTRSVEVGNRDGVAVEVPAGLVELAVLFVERGGISVQFRCSWHLVGAVLVQPPGGGAWKRLEAEELDRYLPRGIEAKIDIQFDGESEIRTVTIPDSGADTVDHAIEGVLRDAHRG